MINRFPLTFASALLALCVLLPTAALAAPGSERLAAGGLPAGDPGAQLACGGGGSGGYRKPARPGHHQNPQASGDSDKG